MIVHGKEKGTLTEDEIFKNELIDLYNQDLNLETAKKLSKLVPDDYKAQNYLKDHLNGNYAELLKINLKGLETNPKSYQAWYQRKYIIQKICNEIENNSGILALINEAIKNEYRLIKLCLEFDPRNFHCWNYKRFIVFNIQKYKLDDTHIEKLNEIANEIFKNYFENYSAGYDLILTRANIDLIDKLFTEPYDEGLWKLHTIQQERSYFVKYGFYVKIFSDHFVVYFNNFVSNCNLKINDNMISSDLNGINTKRIKYNIELHINDIIEINNTKLTFDGYIKSNEDFIIGLFQLEPKCHFVLLEKLKYVHCLNKRKEIIDLLQICDPQRKNYYVSLLNQFYYILY